MFVAFITNEHFDVLVFPLNVFADICESVAKEIAHTTLVVSLAIVSEENKVLVVNLYKNQFE